MTEKKKRVTYYELTPYGKKEEKLHEGNPYSIKGSINDHVIVSIPETMSVMSAEELATSLEDELGKPIICITHNIELLKAKRINASEAKLLENNND